MDSLIPPPAHPALARLFAPGRLTLGLVLPLTHAGNGAEIDLAQQLRLARLADEMGFAALWLRDVPLNSPDYPDPLGHPDPWIMLGALAAQTRRIALVTGAIVAPLRHPLHVAKAALSADALSGQRFLLGLGSGDRAAEFAAFGRDRAEGRQAFRDNWQRIAAALRGEVIPDLHGDAEFEIRPRQASPPLLAVGSAGQTLEWIARNAAAWATYHRDPAQQRDRHALWRRALDKARPAAACRGFAESLRLHLLEDPDHPAESIALGYRLGRAALLERLQAQRAMGTGHVMLNLSELERPVEAVLEELARHVLPALAEGRLGE